MQLTRIHRIWLGLCCLMVASAACREQEPTPRHNRNLGGEGRYLLPTGSEDVGSALAGNRGLEIPEFGELGGLDRQPDMGTADGAAAGQPAPREGKGAISGFLSRLRGAAGGNSAGSDRAADEGSGEE